MSKQNVEKCNIVIQALNDWAVTYAPDMCDPEAVVQAVDRTHQHGTLAYIADASEKMREVISALSEADQRVKDARRVAIEDVLSALTAHELYQYRPKAFQGFIDYARSALQSEER